jgi:hypothetical protein
VKNAAAQEANNKRLAQHPSVGLRDHVAAIVRIDHEFPGASKLHGRAFETFIRTI